VERAGVNDNFFELGGHSLLMAELRSALQAALERPLSMVELFQYPTVRSLAEYLDAATGAASDPLQRARERTESRRASVAQRQAAAARRSRTRE
jgi:acyl carrier protein